MPEFINFDMTDAEYEEAKRVLFVEEVIDWKWTPAQIKEQDDELLNNVLSLKFYGNKIRIQTEKK